MLDYWTFLKHGQDSMAFYRLSISLSGTTLSTELTVQTLPLLPVAKIKCPFLETSLTPGDRLFSGPFYLRLPINYVSRRSLAWITDGEPNQV